MQNPNEDTEWNDILREKGILPAKEVEVDIEEEIDEIDSLDIDERVLERFQRERMKEWQTKSKYGSLEEIHKSDFVTEVTEASKDCSVIVFLYRPGLELCDLLESYLQILCKKYFCSKFVKIIGSSCIPNYPDRNLPTLLIYGKGDIQKQLVGLGLFGGMRTKCEDIECFLKEVGAVIKEEEPQDFDDD